MGGQADLIVLEEFKNNRGNLISQANEIRTQAKSGINLKLKRSTTRPRFQSGPTFRRKSSTSFAVHPSLQGKRHPALAMGK
jgi:hypothetical protein